MLLFGEGLSKVTLFAKGMSILCVNLDKVNLDDDKNFPKMIPKLFFMSDPWLGVIHLKNAKPLKICISKELTPVV